MTKKGIAVGDAFFTFTAKRGYSSLRFLPTR